VSGVLIESYKTVLFASDIFGISDAFLSLLEDVDVSDIAIYDSPYLQPQIHFETEKQAYQCFQDNGGIDAYILRLTKRLKSHENIQHVVGFSAGAAALYKVMSNLPDNNIHVTLFYPGQIRYFLDKHPNNPCHIIFPNTEPHFPLSEVIKVLKQQSQIQVEQNIYEHGFMNKNSTGFDQGAYNFYCKMLSALFSK
jgi:dienelactone hydrolase